VPSLPALLSAVVIAATVQTPRIELARLHPDFSGSWALSGLFPGGAVPSIFEFGTTPTILQTESTIQMGGWRVRLDGDVATVADGVTISAAWDGDALVLTSRERDFGGLPASHRCALRLTVDGTLTINVSTLPENREVSHRLFRRVTGPGTVGPGGVYTPGRGVTAPVLTHDERPAYSQQALFAGIEGIVELDVTVLTDGNVDPATVTVTKSLDKKYGLDDRAIAAARLWRFRPAVLQATSTPVPCRVSIVITFKIGG